MIQNAEPASTNPDFGFMMFDGRYLSTVWSVLSKSEDWLAFLWRDRDSQWRLTHRFRYYRDNKVFDSDDVVSWEDLAFPSTKTETEVIQITDGAADKVALMHPYNCAPVHKIIVRTSSADAYEKIIRREKFMHFKEDEDT